MASFDRPPRLARPARLARPYDPRPWYTRWLNPWTIGLGLTVIMAAVVLIVAVNKGNHKPTVAPAPTSSEFGVPSAGTNPSSSAAPVLTGNAQQDAAALDALRQYPEYFHCNKYPAAASFKAADLVPTANVVVTFTYDKVKHLYVVKADSRVKYVEEQNTESGDGGKTHPVQKFSFVFTTSVHYYGMYQEDAKRGWGVTSDVYDAKTHLYTVTLEPNRGAELPTYVLVAADTATCHAGQVGLPAFFTWDDLSRNGLNTPEFYRSNAGHPQG